MESSALLSILLSLVNLLSAQQLQLPLGANCQDGWVCTTVDKCSALGDLRISRPKICSFGTDNTPVLCCPPENPSPQSSSRVSDMCHNFSQTLCGAISEPSNHELRRPEVVGGILVEPQTHRHMALIGYGDSLDTVKWECGGSIISNNFILCAAHCVENNAKQLAQWVRVGDLDVSTANDDARPETLSIDQRIIHPGYKPPTLYNDIALFRLERPLVFNSWVGPACLSTTPEVTNTHATVTGWGRTDFVGETSSHLLAVDVSLVAPAECKRLLGPSTKIPSGINAGSMICAGEKEGGKDACSGDSGGPLVINSTNCLKTQIGIISFGRMCALPNTPGVYTRVYKFLPWIQSIVWP